PFTLSWYPTPAPGFTSSFRPASGAPGTKVSLTGTNFTGATTVLFNGASAVFTNALSNNIDVRITAIVPPDATDGPIDIHTPHGDVTSTNSFVVLLPRLVARTPPSGAVEISWAATATNITLEAAADLDSGVWATVTQALIRTNGYTFLQTDVGLGNR